VCRDRPPGGCRQGLESEHTGEPQHPLRNSQQVPRVVGHGSPSAVRIGRIDVRTATCRHLHIAGSRTVGAASARAISRTGSTTSGMSAEGLPNGANSARVQAAEPASLPRCLNRSRVVHITNPRDCFTRSDTTQHAEHRDRTSGPPAPAMARNLYSLTRASIEGIDECCESQRLVGRTTKVRPPNPLLRPGHRHGFLRQEVEPDVGHLFDREASPKASTAHGTAVRKSHDARSWQPPSHLRGTWSSDAIHLFSQSSDCHRDCAGQRVLAHSEVLPVCLDPDAT